MRKRYVRKAVPHRLTCHGPHPGQPSVPGSGRRAFLGATWPRPFGKHRATGTSFLRPGTPWQPEAMHCNAGLQDFLQRPRVGQISVKTLPQSPELPGQAQAQDAAGGVFVQSKWGLGERASQGVDVLCVLGHGASGALSTGPRLWVWGTSQHPLQ